MSIEGLPFAGYIDCPHACARPVAPGTTLTLVATKNMDDTGAGGLRFVLAESIDRTKVYRASRWGRSLRADLPPDQPLPRLRRSAEALREGGRVVLHEQYGCEIANTTELCLRLECATRVAAPWACDASIYDCTHAAGDGVLLVGDAASFIEPLSSAGVKKALLSAWRAAVVANTCLKDSTTAGAALDLYNRRERQVHADCLRRSTAFFAEAAAAYGSSFWTARAETAQAGDALPAGADGDWTDEALAQDAGVRDAFAFLRAADGVRLQPAAALRIEPVAAIEGREVVLRDALVVPGAEAPMRFAAGVDLPALAQLARAGRDVSALITAYHDAIGPVPVAGLLTGLSLLVARHALVTEGSPS